MGSSGRIFYYRVNVITITLPDLAERTDDIPLLANHFLERFTKKLRKPVERIGEDAMGLLMDYPWPGNVRELENCIERAVVLAKGASITAAELPPSVRALQQQEGLRLPVGFTLEALERDAILRTLTHCNGNPRRGGQDPRPGGTDSLPQDPSLQYRSPRQGHRAARRGLTASVRHFP